MKYLLIIIALVIITPSQSAVDKRPRPTGTATPVITTPTVMSPTVNLGDENNPTLRACDYYSARWGRKGAKGTESDPFQWNKRIKGKVMCGINSEEVDQIVNGR